MFKKLFTILFTIILAGVVVIFASPYWVLYQLKNAYETKDVHTINAHIDFPKLQQNLTEQLTPKIIEKITPFANSPLLQAMNIQINQPEMVYNLVNTAVSRYVSADGVSQVLTGQAKANELVGIIAVAMGKVEISDLLMAKDMQTLANQVAKQAQVTNETATQPETNYCGFNCFQVSTQVKGYPITLKLERQNLLEWKIVAIDLPF